MRRRADIDTVFASALETEQVLMISGVPRHTVAGWILVTDKAGTPLNTLPPEIFDQYYEPIVEGSMTLSPDQVTRAAKLVRLGGLRTSEEFVQALEALAHVRIGGVEINWTPSQLDELTRRAQKRGWTVEKYVDYLVQRFLQDMWSI